MKNHRGSLTNFSTVRKVTTVTSINIRPVIRIPSVDVYEGTVLENRPDGSGNDEEGQAVSHTVNFLRRKGGKPNGGEILTFKVIEISN